MRSQERPGRRAYFAALVAAAVVVWAAVMLVAGDSGVIALFRTRSRLGEMEERVRTLEAENARLRDEVRRLEHDEAAIERLAREELRMARADEEVIVVPDVRRLGPTGTPTGTPTPPR